MNKNTVNLVAYKIGLLSGIVGGFISGISIWVYQYFLDKNYSPSIAVLGMGITFLILLLYELHLLKKFNN